MNFKAFKKICKRHRRNVRREIQNYSATSLEKGIERCFELGESVVFIETHDRCDKEKLLMTAQEAGYNVWMVHEKTKNKPLLKEERIGEKLRRPGHEKCFYYLTCRYNNDIADRDYQDEWFVTFLKKQLDELYIEGDKELDGLEVPVTIVLDNMVLLSFALGDSFEVFMAAMQRKRNNLHIVACL